jgi:hypothetical protein
MQPAALHAAVCVCDRTEEAFRRTRDRQAEVVLQPAGPASPGSRFPIVSAGDVEHAVE